MLFANRVKSLKPSATLEITAKANQLKQEGFDVIGFGAGEPDFDTPEHIKQAAINAINSGKTKYTPVAGILELRKAVAKKFSEDYGVEFLDDEVIVSCGGKHSLFNIFMSILNKGDEVIIPSPYWVSYPAMVELCEGKPVIINAEINENFKLTPEKLEKAITDKTKAVVINSPSNPTGASYSYNELKEILDILKDKNLYIISDDIYYKITYDNYKFVNAVMIYPEIKDKIIIVNGVSKTYSMTGWRIGFTIANKELVKTMSKIQGQSTSNPTSIAQYAALEAITGNQDCINEMVTEFKKRRDYIVNELNSIDGINCYNPEGAFYVFPDISNIIKRKGFKGSAEFSAKLLEDKKVAVVPGVAFGNDNHIRLSYATSMENIKEGIKRIKEFCQND